MKDSFFKHVDKLYSWIFKIITRIAYVHITKGRCKTTPRLTRSEKKSIQDYWKKTYGKKIPLWEFRWYKGKRGAIEPEIIPDVVWHSEIEPFYTNLQLEKGFQDKNYFEMIVGKENSPYSIIHCINGQYLNHQYKPITKENVVEILSTEKEVICKPSIETGGGRGICFLNGKDVSFSKVEAIEKAYNKNYLIQSIIEQSKYMAAFNSCSINTLRIVSFLHKGNVHILSSFLRVGSSDSRLDNVSSGGCFIPANVDGHLKNIAYKEDFKTNDLISFEISDNIKPLVDQSIPNWKEVVKLVKETHYKLSHFGIVHWDIALDYNDKPIIIEYNIIDASSYFHQISIGPIFGLLTHEVLEEVKNGR